MKQEGWCETERWNWEIHHKYCKSARFSYSQPQLPLPPVTIANADRGDGNYYQTHHPDSHLDLIRNMLKRPSPGMKTLVETVSRKHCKDGILEWKNPFHGLSPSTSQFRRKTREEPHLKTWTVRLIHVKEGKYSDVIFRL